MGSLHSIIVVLLNAVACAIIGIMLGFFAARRTIGHRYRSLLTRRRHALKDLTLEHRIKNSYASEVEAAMERAGWDWSVDAKYAIGKGLITHQESAVLENGSLAQSDLSLGLILPLSLLIWSVATRFGLNLLVWGSVLTGVVLSTAILFMIGMERRERYELDLQSLILGNAARKDMELVSQKNNSPGEASRK